MVGRGVGIFRKRALLCGVDRCAYLAAETADWDSRRKKNNAVAESWKAFAMFALESHHSFAHHAYRLNTIFVFPAISVMLPLYVRNILHLGAKSMGGLMAVSGSGAFLGSIGLLSVARENRLKFMSGNVVAIAVGVFLMSRVQQGFLLTACAMGAIAIALSMNFGLSNTIVQEHAPAHLRGRVSAVVGMSFFGLMPVAGLITPGFADLIGMRTTLTIASIVYGIAAVAILSVAGRHVCDPAVTPTPETQPEIEPVC